MPTSQVTATGKAGPGLTVTAQVFTPVSSFTVRTAEQLLDVVVNGVVQTVDIAGKTTFTVTVSGGAYTVSVS